MKKSILGAIVIFFVTLASLLVFDDISKGLNPNSKQNVEVYKNNQQPDMVVKD